MGDVSHGDREGRGHVTTEAETGMWPQAKEQLQTPGAGEAGRAPFRASGGIPALPTPRFLISGF